MDFQLEQTHQDFHKNRFESIQILRGITALFIIFEHIQFLNCGAFGVDIFFVISGFMIMFSTHSTHRYFFRKRLIRIIPLYYLMTISIYIALLCFPSLFEITTASPEYLIKSLLFIPFDLNGATQPLLRVGWSLNCEMFFYICFYIAMRISHKYRGLICSIFIIVLDVLSGFIPLLSGPIGLLTSPIMLDFVFGIICYYISRYLYEHHFHQLCHPIITLSTVLLCVSSIVILAITKNQLIHSNNFSRPLTWGIPAMLIFLFAFIAGFHFLQKNPSNNKNLLLKALLLLGNMSYSLYLLHYIPIRFFDRFVFDFSTCTSKSIVGAIFSVLLCILLAYLSYILFEQKLSSQLKHYLIEKTPKKKSHS